MGPDGLHRRTCGGFSDDLSAVAVIREGTFQAGMCFCRRGNGIQSPFAAGHGPRRSRIQCRSRFPRGDSVHPPPDGGACRTCHAGNLHADARGGRRPCLLRCSQSENPQGRVCRRGVLSDFSDRHGKSRRGKSCDDRRFFPAFRSTCVFLLRDPQIELEQSMDILFCAHRFEFSFLRIFDAAVLHRADVLLQKAPFRQIQIPQSGVHRRRTAARRSRRGMDSPLSSPCGRQSVRSLGR